MTLEIRSVTIGAGKPKICIPLVGSTMDEIIEESKTALTLPCQLVEWRADHFLAHLRELGVTELEQMGTAMVPVLRHLRRTVELPLIVTVRTREEGGRITLSKADYFNLNGFIAQTKTADFVDIQAFEGPGQIDDATIQSFLAFAHQYGTRVLLSNHDFQQTPPVEEMLTRLFAMESLGGDMIKLAVMPQSEADVLALLEASALMRDSGTTVPIIAVSMGELGMSSRICGGEYGSSVTFAAGKDASAPGQIGAEALHKFMEQYY